MMHHIYTCIALFSDPIISDIIDHIVITHLERFQLSHCGLTIPSMAMSSCYVCIIFWAIELLLVIARFGYQRWASSFGIGRLITNTLLYLIIGMTLLRSIVGVRCFNLLHQDHVCPTIEDPFLCPRFPRPGLSFLEQLIFIHLPHGRNPCISHPC